MPNRLRAPSASYLTEQSVIEYLKAIECPCLLVRGEEGMVTDTDAFLARKEAFGASGGGVLQDLVLPGKHHFHVSRRADFEILINTLFFNAIYVGRLDDLYIFCLLYLW